MTSERTLAYGLVVKTLDDLGPAKLQPTEQDRIRDAADTLIFARRAEDARGLAEGIEELVEHLVASGRWVRERTAAPRRPAACGRSLARTSSGPALRASQSSRDSSGRLPTSSASRQSRSRRR